MSIRLIADVVNQLGSPALYSNSLANRPPAGFGGRLFISSDTHEIYQDVITGWNLIADAGAGAGTLDSVTHNGNTTTWGINILGGDLTLQATQKLYVLGLSNGGVLFPSGGSGLISQDNTNFVWDNTNKYLGIGTNAPTATFDIHSGSNVMQQLNSTGTNNSFLAFLNQDVGKWRIGNLYGGGNNDMVIYDTANGTYRAYFTNTGYTILPNSVIIGSSSRSSSYTLDVSGTGRFTGTLYAANSTTTGSSTLLQISKASGYGTINFNLSYDSTYFSNGKNLTLLNEAGYSAAIFAWNNAGTQSNFLVPNGNVGINISNPSSILHIKQSASSFGLWCESQSNDSQFRFSIVSTTEARIIATYVSTGSYLPITFFTSDLERMRILANGTIQMGIEVYNTVTSGTTRTLFIGNGTYSIGGVSSIRASKKNIKEFDSKWIYDLKPIEFNYRKKDENGSYTEEIFEEVNYGLIAEDTQPIADFLINYDDTEDNKKMVGIEYSRLITPMLKAIQELNEKLIRNNIN
jgi:hypothetical protein